MNNVSDRIADLQTMTVFAFLDKADVGGAKPRKDQARPPHDHQEGTEKPSGPPNGRSLQLRHNIEVHLPATKDIEVYNAIFKALKEHLLD